MKDGVSRGDLESPTSAKTNPACHERVFLDSELHSLNSVNLTDYTFLLEGSYWQGIKYIYIIHMVYIHINDTVDGRNPKTTTWDIL